MRVLHVVGTLNPVSGGPAAAVAALVEFSHSGCANEVVTLDDPKAEFLARLPFQVHALGPVGTKYGYTKRLLPWLRANADRFDGAVVHGLWQYCGFAAWRAFRGRKPYMVYAHGMLDPYFKHAFPLKHLKKLIYWLLAEHWILRDAYSVLFTGCTEEWLAKQSFFLNRWKGAVVRLGANVPDGDPDRRKAIFLGRFPQLEGRRYLLFLGRIDRKKGCDLLIEAFVRVARLNPGLDLVMAGPDTRNWQQELGRTIVRAKLTERVHWTGLLHGEEKWAAFLGCEAFVLPSHQENFGIAVAEAMALCRPVLLSDKVNIAADVQEAGAGLVETDTAAGVLKVLEDWISLTPEQRAEMGLKARQLFERSYDMRINTRALTHLFREAVQPMPGNAVVSASAAE